MLPRMGAAGAVAVIVAAGSGTRLGRTDPRRSSRSAAARWWRSRSSVPLASPSIARVVVVAPPGYEDAVRDALGATAGPARGRHRRRHPSSDRSRRASMRSMPAPDVVAVHDAARPFASAGAVHGGRRGRTSGRGCRGPGPAARRHGETRARRLDRRDGASRRARAGADAAGVSRRSSSATRSRRRDEAGLDFTDDAGLLEWAGASIRTVAGEPAELQDHDAARTSPGPSAIVGDRRE